MRDMNEYVYKNQKKLRCGFTTGTCAAACAQAAMIRLLTGQLLQEVTVQLPLAPKGRGTWRDEGRPGSEGQQVQARSSMDENVNEWPREKCTMPERERTLPAGVNDFHDAMTRVTLSVYPTEDGGFATRKDAGDDPDVTNGTEIRAYVEPCIPWPSEDGEDAPRPLTSEGKGTEGKSQRGFSDDPDDPEKAGAGDTQGLSVIGKKQPWVCAPKEAFASRDGRLYLTGGVGVGRVTKPGLEQAIGQSAINRVPRQMIFTAVQQVLQQFEDAFEENQRQEVPTEKEKSREHRENDENAEKNDENAEKNENIENIENTEKHENKEKNKNRCYLITISVPEGAKLAARTFNPRLGIVGGISILGTTGIVEPMSEAAIVRTIETSIRQALALEVETSERRRGASQAAYAQMKRAAADGKGPDHVKMDGRGCAEAFEEGMHFPARRILAVPGNYGQRYVEENLGLRGMPVVEISNYIGEALDLAVSYGVTEFLLVGNIGKLVKLAAGIMNTHSRVADGRWEIFAAHLALAGGTRTQIEMLREAITTEEMLTQLEEMGLRAPVMQSILAAVEQHLAHRIRGQMRFGVIIYSERFGCVGKTQDAEALLQEFRGAL